MAQILSNMFAGGLKVIAVSWDNRTPQCEATGHTKVAAACRPMIPNVASVLQTTPPPCIENCIADKYAEKELCTYTRAENYRNARTMTT